MSNMSKVLKDDGARRDAISLHDRSILVEAGAGSGKTAVMAGRIAAMLAEGVAPRSIAAVTFTELAASELLSRVREFVADLSAGTIATELRVALPDGLSQAHRDNLATASAAIDEITCSTIHGFCQRLIKPYPAEADIDPGAGVMDRNQADLTFLEIVDGWLRERLSGGQGGVLAEMVLHSPGETVALIHKIAENLRRRPTLTAPLVSPLEGHLTAFRQAVADFAGFLDGIAAVEPETVTIAEQLAEMATAVADGPDPATPAGLIRLLTSRPHPDLCKKDGAFYSYRKKGKWAAAAKQAGLAKADGDRLNDAADAHYAACCESWISLVQSAAGHALAALMDEARPILQRYREHKRASAQLDFDDLIFAARDLLRDHDAVRRSLGQRFAHVLVDEFQDTDPLQTEIFWRLCGEPVDGEDDWTQFRIRPGALFLVGDPKQAIYRFRGADVGAYVQARDAFRDQNPDSLLSISTNFRSCGSILTFVNERFEAVLSADGQPGFTALDSFHEDRGGLCVAALDITVADENGKASAEKQRDAEADAIAQLCAQLIESHPIIDRRSGAERPCLPGDIALLAPTGAELWRYEEALERRGIPVATQAGKGLFRRQEIQDLIALSRVLADRRDTLALGALLRGPLVGLTEEELLDIIWGLPRTEEQPDRIPRLDLSVDPAALAHPLARDIIERLQSLSRRVNSTTPHELLSQAVDVMRVRPLLLERHRGQAERALANVDLYLSLSTGYAVRGLRAFAEAMTAAWSDEARAVEGRPDAQEEAVALFTMHAAKGLEWPIVIPINTMTGVMAPESAVIDRQAETFYCPVLGVAPEGYETVRQAEKEELDRERIRLWYVAATRARELLVLPRLDITPSKSAWIGLVDLSLADLPALDASHLPAGFTTTAAGVANPQTRASFAAEAETIAAAQTRLTWLAPSRDENAAGRVLREEEPSLWTGSADDLPPELETTAQVQGGRERGLILHKLMEEVLTGETLEAEATLTDRAADLIRAFGKVPVADPATGLCAGELAGCVARSLALPEIAALRPELLAEFPVYALNGEGSDLMATAGIADALTIGSDGRPVALVDWKSDVNPNAQTLDHYRAQVSAYLDMTGADRGLIVLMTSGRIIEVQASAAIS
ncbi:MULTISPECIES: UvrD-helicase domain-containing protein [Sphingomonas]|uniref:DNA 3'-5' helicase n=1 Tax=Sphingomonas pseudosanguinis TaxID=413712 RepID=A0A7W6AAG8_9SPHN|nr:MULTISPECIES: UvrD-helicase domain-containing protein [Sphingomonas]MBB3880221.1 exodeoxyribonuclease-5 [Sphingomonas pseudosanguinis]MBN3535591.1 UvrD-helicase domain-containing protein [Sphingomonas pseudosanguinis]PZU79812.1 MAG: ATP-dependent endonuclease [Sphingomonas sp.]